MTVTKGVLHTDGGARGNPGVAGIGVVLTTPSGDVIADLAEGIGETTNNVAEYKALIAGLRLALEHGVSDVEIKVDSELVASQMNGLWKIKNDRLRHLAVEARSLFSRFERATISVVPRELNADADKLANQGMDAAALDVEAQHEVFGRTSLPD